MARFKLVKVGKKEKRRIEVQKVKFRLRPGALIFSLIFAFLVWFYVKGSTYRAPEQPTEEPTGGCVSEADTTSDMTQEPEEALLAAYGGVLER
ncbi:MAG: hypothetical protein E7645_01610 [Ruminococcaceae bacterium]|nr:hypothetical protein [Oscillospiraceae bacterium]